MESRTKKRYIDLLYKFVIHGSGEKNITLTIAQTSTIAFQTMAS